MQKKYLILVSLILSPMAVSTAVATPKNVIIIRHADKVPGRMFLSAKGYERAAALPYYFLETPLYNTPPISSIFAVGLGDLGGPQESARPIETATPTAVRYKLTINSNFKQGDHKALVQEILTNKKYDGKTVLVCWEHKEIHKVIEALGGGYGTGLAR